MAKTLTMTASATDSRWDGLVAGYAALAIVIHILEAGLPSPIPGIKPGLANVVSLIVMLRYGWALAAWVVMLRVLVSALLLGTFLTPTFLLSAAGACASLFGLGMIQLLHKGAGRNLFSSYGLGMLSSCLHIGGQFFVAYSLFVPHPGLLNLLPILASAALVFGLTTGWLAQKICQSMDELETQQASARP